MRGKQIRKHKGRTRPSVLLEKVNLQPGLRHRTTPSPSRPAVRALSLPIQPASPDYRSAHLTAQCASTGGILMTRYWWGGVIHVTTSERADIRFWPSISSLPLPKKRKKRLRGKCKKTEMERREKQKSYYSRSHHRLHALPTRHIILCRWATSAGGISIF